MTRTHTRLIELSEQRCRHLLATALPRLGRLAFAEDGDPDWPTVLPINYALVDDAIYLRTFEGSKLYAALRRQRVAFEIDEVDVAWQDGWSVMALGTLELVTDLAERDRANASLRSWATDADQPVLRIDVTQLTGREIMSVTTPG